MGDTKASLRVLDIASFLDKFEPASDFASSLSVPSPYRLLLHHHRSYLCIETMSQPGSPRPQPEIVGNPLLEEELSAETIHEGRTAFYPV